MPQEHSSRDKTRARMSEVLKTPDGEVLMEELFVTWDTISLMGGTPEETAYKVGQRDAFRHLIWLRDGDD